MSVMHLSGMCLSVYPSVCHPFVSLSFHPFVHQSVRLSICVPFICLTVCLSIPPSACIFICLSVCLYDVCRLTLSSPVTGLRRDPQCTPINWGSVPTTAWTSQTSSTLLQCSTLILRFSTGEAAVHLLVVVPQPKTYCIVKGVNVFT